MTRPRHHKSENTSRRWHHATAWALACAVLVLMLWGQRWTVGSDPWSARIYGWAAPIIFALCAALVTCTSPRWRDRVANKRHPAAGRLRWLSSAATLGIYVEIVLGVQLGHVPADWSPGAFQLTVWLHLAVGGIVAIAAVWLVVSSVRRFGEEPAVVGRAGLLMVLLVIQVVLCAAAWVTSYGRPAWFTDYVWEIAYTVVAEGRLQALATTGAVAAGWLNLGVSLSLAMWFWRLVREKTPVPSGR